MHPQLSYAPLSPYNCSLILIDYQPQYAFTINSFDVHSLETAGEKGQTMMHCFNQSGHGAMQRRACPKHHTAE